MNPLHIERRTVWISAVALLIILVSTAAYLATSRSGGEPSLARDTSPPTLRIVSPTEGTTVEGVVNLEVQARDESEIKRVEYALGNSPFASLRVNTQTTYYEAQIDTTNLGDGFHTITVRVFDSADLASQKQINLTVDNQPPRLSIVRPVEGTVLKGSVTLYAEAIDHFSGIMTVEYSLDGEDLVLLTRNTYSGLYETIIDTTTLDGPIHNLTVRAVDRLNHPTIVQIDLLVDNEEPILSIISPVPGAVVPGTTTIKVRARDNVGLRTLEYTLDGRAYQPLRSNGEVGVYEAQIDITALSGARQTITVRATDGAGHTAQATTSITLDNQPAVLGIIQPGVGALLHGVFTVQVQAEDNIRVANVEYSLDGETFRPLRLNSKTGLYEASIDTATLDEGSRSITVRATDRAGNTAQASTTIVVAALPLSVTIISPAEGALLQGTVTILAQASDELQLAAMEYALDDGPFQPLTLDRGTRFYETVVDTTMLDVGNHSITVRATGWAGNLVQTSVNVKVDNRLVFISPKDGESFQDSITLQVRAADELKLTTVEYALDGDSFVPLSFNEETGFYEAIIDITTIDPGDYSITVRGTDEAGDTFSFDLSVSVDKPTQIGGGGGSGVGAGEPASSDDFVFFDFDFDSSESVSSDSGADAGDTASGTGETTGEEGDVSQPTPPVIVAVDNPPSVSILTSVEGSIVGALTTSSITVVAQCTDDKGLTVVEFQVDGGPFAPMTATNQELGLFELVIQTANLSSGNHVITVRATDTAGQSTSVQISITVDTQAPVVTIVSPADGFPVPVSAASIALAVEASDDLELATVEFALGVGDFAAMTLNETTGLFEASIDTAILARGTNTLSVRANDSAGQATIAQIIVITDDQPPVVTLINPEPPALQVIAGGVEEVEVNVNDGVSGSGVARVEFQAIPLAAGVTAAFELLEVFPPAPPGVPIVVPATLHPNPVADTTPVPAGLPQDSIALFVFVGVLVVAVDGNGQEWQVEAGGKKFFVYTSAGTELQTTPTAGQTVKIVATRTLEPGPIVAEVIRPRPLGDEVELLFLLNGVVESADAEKWRIGGVDFVLVGAPEPTSFEIPLPPELGVTVVSAEFAVPLEAIPPTPDDAAWQDATLNPATGLWEVDWQVPLREAESTGWVFIRATDGAGNTTVSLSKVSILPDVSPPVVAIISPAADETVSGTVTLTAGAVDDVEVIQVQFFVDGILIGSATEAPFSLAWNTVTVGNGVHILTAEAIDPTGNTGASGAVGVIVANFTPASDSVAPLVTAPAPITVEAASPAGNPATDPAIAAFLAGASAVDDIDGPLPVTNDAPLDFPIGVTTVTFSATDAAGNTGTTAADVTVADTIAPQVAPPAPITVEAASPAGTPVTDPAIAAFLADVTAVDDIDVTLLVANDAPLTFPIGVTTVTFSATDAAGNTGTAAADVTVVDTIAPGVTAPAPITVAATSPAGTSATDPAIAAFLTGATAVDNIDGVVVPVTNDAPLVDFPIGVTTVTFSATDAAGNTGTAVADVTVAVVVSLSAPPSVIPGRPFTARVNVSSIADFDAGQFDVSFDPSVLAIDGVGVTDGIIGVTTIPAIGRQLTLSTFRVVVSLPLGDPGVSGSGFLAEIHFRALGPLGTTTIDLANVVLSDSTAQEIPSIPQGSTLTVVTQ